MDSCWYSSTFKKTGAYAGSSVEAVLLEALCCASSLERARAILCGLEFRYVLHPFYGVLRGVKRKDFYYAAQELYRRKSIAPI